MKKNDLLIVIFIFITIFSIIIVKPISDLDEIWNYNTARVISEGLIPYKDISMITTPLLVYKIFGELFKEKNVALICTALIGILCRDIYCIDYNVTVLFIALIVLYQELKNINSQDFDKRREFLIRNISRICNMYKTEYRSYTCNNCCRI